VFPTQEGRSELLSDESLGKEELDESTTEDLGELLGVVNGQEEEPSVGGETPFQDQGMPVGVRSEKITEGLKSNDACRAQKGGSCGQAVELSDQGEDERGDRGEQLLVVTEEDSQGLGALAAQARLPPEGMEKTNCRCGSVTRSCSSKYSANRRARFWEQDGQRRCSCQPWG
jgi:hypothetical protein